MVDPVCRERRRLHIYILLGWRYFRVLASDDIYSSSDEVAQNAPQVPGFGYRPSDIDRAVWPQGYVHVENSMLVYKQPAAAA